MNIEIIKEIARLRGVNPNNKDEIELIRAMQRKEGFEACFGTKTFSCRNTVCMWHFLCQSKIHKFEVK